MALKHSTGLRNFCLTSGFKSAFDTDGRINIYAGTIPSNADNACTGTLLATLNLSATAFQAAASGALVANAISNDTAADNSGTPAYFVFYKASETAPGSAASGTDKRLIGTVTASGGGGDITFDNTTFVQNGVVAISSFTYTHSV